MVRSCVGIRFEGSAGLARSLRRYAFHREARHLLWSLGVRELAPAFLTVFRFSFLQALEPGRNEHEGKAAATRPRSAVDCLRFWSQPEFHVRKKEKPRKSRGALLYTWNSIRVVISLSRKKIANALHLAAYSLNR